MCLCWAPGHSGILDSETTDVFAIIHSLFGGDLLVGPDSHICHYYGLINGWVGEEERH